jgi:hypothetical protein
VVFSRCMCIDACVSCNILTNKVFSRSMCNILTNKSLKQRGTIRSRHMIGVDFDKICVFCDKCCVCVDNVCLLL